MITLNQKNSHLKLKKVATDVPLNCRCGGKPSKPQAIENCENRWVIRCKVEQCYAYNIGQGLADTIQGWNRLSTHFYR
ncbi:MAG: hypothetical protein ACI9C4_003080 [Paraglaciecola sp.]|jgi:hypothetical protein